MDTKAIGKRRLEVRYTLDTLASLSAGLACGLTQVLADGENLYLYGVGRIGEQQPGGWQYHLSDALGSVRQLTDETGAVTLAKSYRPYGDVLSSNGSAVSSYGFTGEWTDVSGMVYLRARYYSPWVGRFVSRDTWAGDAQQPMSYNGWLYVEGNPINYVDFLGHWRWWLSGSPYHMLIEQYYEQFPLNPSKQLEFPIPGTPRRHPDMFNSALGDVYEIEPWFLRACSKITSRVSGIYRVIPIGANSVSFDP